MAADQDCRGYSLPDTARLCGEAPKSNPRSPFARDRARVLHSWAIRRLADKTQVLLPGESDFPRTRLTHTLEVAQIAREIGQSLGCDPDLVDTAGLSHDLGHPPFGHNGEAALDALASDIGGFEGNAQSFRVLTRLESKVFEGDRSFGLNLTRASLDATIKYPWLRKAGVAKFNAYVDDAEVFGWVRDDAPAGRRCLEAQVMDWADDVAYSVHDVEDAIYSGFVRPRDLADDGPLANVVAIAMRDYAGRLTEPELGEAVERLRTLQIWPRSFTGSMHSLAQLKQMTSGLIGRFSEAATSATLATAGPGPLTRYGADLVVPREQLAEVAVLKSVASHFVFNREGVSDVYAEQRQLLTDLVLGVAERGRDGLRVSFRPAWDAAADDGARLRVSIDQVASLTDVSAVRLHSSLFRADD